VQANFAKGSYVTKQYSILDAGSISGSFGQLVSTNLLPIFSASLSYDDPKHVYLKLSVIDDGNWQWRWLAVGGGWSGGGGGGQGGSDPLAGYNINQRNVVNAFRRSAILAGGELSGMYATLTSTAGLTQVSGETAVRFAAGDVRRDGPVHGRDAGSDDGRARRIAPQRDGVDAAQGAGRRGLQFALGGAGRPASAARRASWRCRARLQQDHQQRVTARAVGADYRLSPNTVAGFALAGGGTSFPRRNGGSGNSDLFQAGGYLRHTAGRGLHRRRTCLWLAGRHHQPHRHGAGFDTLRGRFNANALSGRLEGGYRVAGAIMDVTPYAAGQFISYRLPSYAEQVAPAPTRLRSPMAARTSPRRAPSSASGRSEVLRRRIRC
jgi:hypothetical protein